MIQRRIGKLLLGKATPFQVLAACIIGSILGFVPGVLQAPGSIVLLLALLAVLNANLWLAALMTLGTKILSFALLPVSHAVDGDGALGRHTPSTPHNQSARSAKRGR